MSTHNSFSTSTPPFFPPILKSPFYRSLTQPDSTKFREIPSNSTLFSSEVPDNQSSIQNSRVEFSSKKFLPVNIPSRLKPTPSLRRRSRLLSPPAPQGWPRPLSVYGHFAASPQTSWDTTDGGPHR